MIDFSYSEFTTRNLGFVTEAEQERLRNGCVFVCGNGGMGGAAVMTLIRAGLGNLILADIDRFDVSNLNRQLFATLDTVGQPKSEATRDMCLRLNPDAKIEVLGADWTDQVDRIVGQAQVVVNGTDDLGASLLLYRTARATGRHVIDAYASPLPSVYVTGPHDPSPEERLGYSTTGTDWNALTDPQRDAAMMAEATYVMTHSTSRHHVDLALAGEVIAGTRSRMSFAPMVITSGTLMAGEALQSVLGRAHVTDYRGYFFNPYKGKVEKPLPNIVAKLMAPIVRRKMNAMIGA
ncbi:MAG: ThiF family adenylyltransferase [Pseudomonadota bacterium]